MDTLSTGIGGALLARALPEKVRGPSGVWAVTLASVVPDADVFADFFTYDPLGDITQHRGFTHSIVGAVVMAPLIALVLRRFGKDRSYRRLLVLALLGLGWHMFTDLATSWGTMIYYPFSRDRVVWDLVFIIDFIFTAILLLPHLLAWVYGRPATALRRGSLVWALLAAFTALVISLGSPLFGMAFNWRLMALLAAVQAALLLLPAVRGWGFRQSALTFCRAGASVLAVYLAICAISHLRAVQLAGRMAAERNLAVLSLAALPQPLSPFRWSGLVLTPEGVYQSWFDVLDSERPAFRFYASVENGYVARARQLPQVRTYLWFARFPVASYRTEEDRHIVEYSDRRFQWPRDDDPSFVFRVVFDARGQVLSSGFVEPR